MLHAAPLWRQNLVRVLARQGLSELEARILHKLAVEAGPVLQKGLGAALVTEPSTLARSLQRLEHRGLLKRSADKSDRRAFTVALTSEGAEAAQNLQHTIRAKLNQLIGPDVCTQAKTLLG
jgi:DNA-binding MarR family transcriptional regulator